MKQYFGISMKINENTKIPLNHSKIASLKGKERASNWAKEERMA